jgi:hypothetical protein
MADGLSAVATNASPRALAKASWLARRIPFAKTVHGTPPKTAAARSLNVSRLFINTGSLIQTAEQTP